MFRHYHCFHPNRRAISPSAGILDGIERCRKRAAEKLSKLKNEFEFRPFQKRLSNHDEEIPYFSDDDFKVIACSIYPQLPQLPLFNLNI